jgi:hypothetical protein
MPGLDLESNPRLITAARRTLSTLQPAQLRRTLAYPRHTLYLATLDPTDCYYAAPRELFLVKKMRGLLLLALLSEQKQSVEKNVHN